MSEAMSACRSGTLALVANLDDATLCRQTHPDFSPVGWHLGHIAFTEAYWILEQLAGLPPQFCHYDRLFVADGLPKAARCQLPSLPEILDYLATVRSQVLAYLKAAPLAQQERLWWWLLQHESQHCETMTLVLEMQRVQTGAFRDRLPQAYDWATDSGTPDFSEMVCVPAGEFMQGNGTIVALDNERPAHSVYLDTYWIDRYPVTCGQYRQFMEVGGYRDPQWWSEAGWQWLNSPDHQGELIHHPLYWTDHPAWDHHPVCGISWYEAQAYSQFVGKRLPTEAEWEKAAHWQGCQFPGGSEPGSGNATPPAKADCNFGGQWGETTIVHAFPHHQSDYGCFDLLGNVWEWTDSWFDGYAGFTAYPYPGYSQAYFDGQHRVLRGGSWATRDWGLRSTLRNWYYPSVRQILAGFRCVC